MLLGDADVEELLRHALGEMGKAGATGHRASDADDLGIGPGEPRERLTEDILVVRGRAGRGLSALTGDRVEGSGAVKLLRMRDRRLESFALLGQDVDDDRHVAVLRKLEVLLERLQIVSVHRPQVAQPEFFEQRRLDEEVLRLALPLHVHPIHLHARGEALEERLHVVMELVVRLVRADPVEVIRDRPDILRDRPLVVVEDHDQPLGRADDIVQRLERDSAGERSIAAHGDHVLLGSAQVAGRGHAEGRGKRGAGVSRPKRIVRAFPAIEETAGAAGLPQAPEEFAAAPRQQLVHVALVGDVEDELVVRRVEHPMQRDRQLDDAQVGTDVPAVLGGDRDELLANLLRELR